VIALMLLGYNLQILQGLPLYPSIFLLRPSKTKDILPVGQNLMVIKKIPRKELI
jgi:hypothetical protein